MTDLLDVQISQASSGSLDNANLVGLRVVSARKSR